MLEFFTNNLGSVVAVLTALLGALIALHIRQRNQFSAAASAFRAAFSESLTALRHTDLETYSILQAAFPAHEMAVLEFEKLLPWISRRLFMAAWRDYHQMQGATFLEQYHRVTATFEGIAPKQDRRALAIQRIESMLAYAKP